MRQASRCQLVSIAREVFGRRESFVGKFTGRSDRPLQAIREFRNRRREFKLDSFKWLKEESLENVDALPELEKLTG